MSSRSIVKLYSGDVMLFAASSSVALNFTDQFPMSPDEPNVLEKLMDWFWPWRITEPTSCHSPSAGVNCLTNEYMVIVSLSSSVRLEER